MSDADVLDEYFPIELLNRVVNALLQTASVADLVLANNLNTAVGASARSRMRRNPLKETR